MTKFSSAPNSNAPRRETGERSALRRWLAVRRNLAMVGGAMVLLVAAVIVLFARSEHATPPKAATAASKDTVSEHVGEGHHEIENRVTLTEAAFATAQIEVAPAQPGSPALAGAGLEVPGQVEFDPSRVALVSPRSDGRIERLGVVEGDRVRAGQPVAWLQSKEYLIAQSDLAQAARRASVLAGGPDAEGAQALVRAARQRLTLLGLPSGEITRLERGGEPQLYLPLVAPMSGVVIKAHVLAGQAVTAGSPVFTVADLNTLDVVAAIQERSVPLISVGQAASVTLNALPTLPLKGRVERLRGELSPETRTVQAVIHVTNSSGQLRPGMFATVRIAMPANATPEMRAAGTAAPTDALTIPESAVVTDGDQHFVFVQVAPLVFERRQVEIAPLAPAGSNVVASAFVLVRGGLKAGERVVSRGAFTLKSEMAKAGLGDEH